MENTFGRRFSRNFPLLLLVILEIALGIMLFVNPDSVTLAAILLFGILLAILGVFSIVRYIALRRQGYSVPFTLVLGILNVVLGALLLIFPNVIMTFVKGFIGALFILYGIGMIVSGIYKIYLFYSMKHVDVPVTLFTAVAGIVSVLLGVLILVNLNTAQEIMWRIAGIALLVEAALDAVSFVMNLMRK